MFCEVLCLGTGSGVVSCSVYSCPWSPRHPVETLGAHGGQRNLEIIHASSGEVTGLERRHVIRTLLQTTLQVDEKGTWKISPPNSQSSVLAFHLNALEDAFFLLGVGLSNKHSSRETVLIAVVIGMSHVSTLCSLFLVV